MGTFRTWAQGGTLLDFDKFSEAIDLYATMEVDNVDLDPTPYATPGQTPMLSPLQSGASFSDEQSIGLELRNIGSLDLNAHLGISSCNSDTDTNMQYINYAQYSKKSPKAVNVNEMKSLLPKLIEADESDNDQQ